jgi:gluconolactonase
MPHPNSRFAATLLGSLLFLTLQACGPQPADSPVGAEEGAAADASPARPTTPGQRGWIESRGQAFDALVPAEAAVEELAAGFQWTEGPVWVDAAGGLLFSDVPQNTIFRWRQGEGVDRWLSPSGYTGAVPRGGEPGSNGLLLDAEGRLLVCQHGDRRVARLDQAEGFSWDRPAASFTTLASGFDSKRFHSPNDLVLDAQGRLYFTDPPYGLEGGVDGPGRELSFQGVYRLDPDGAVTLLTDKLSRPNGIALSPDGRTLYVANSDPGSALWMAWNLSPTGNLEDERVFFDATDLVGDEHPGLPDGMAVDIDGNLFATGPGGIFVFAPDGTQLGSVRLAQASGNCAFGEDGSSLFVTSDDYLLRVRLTTRGLGFP